MEILIVHENKELRENLKRILELLFEKIKITTCRDGKEGILKLKEHQFNLVLIDRFIEQRTELLKYLKEKFPQTKIIICSTNIYFGKDIEVLENFSLKELEKKISQRKICSKKKIMFWGTFKRKLDQKRRLSLPRKIIKKLGGKKLWLKISENKIELYPINLCPSKKDIKDLYQIEIDKYGRLLFPKEVCKKMQIKSQSILTLIGRGDYIEIIA